MTFDGRAADHVMKFCRPSLSIFAHCKQSKTGGVEGLGTRLISSPTNSLPGNEASEQCCMDLGGHWDRVASSYENIKAQGSIRYTDRHTMWAAH